MHKPLFTLITLLTINATALATHPASAPTTSAPTPRQTQVAAKPVHIDAIVAQTLALSPELRFYENEIACAAERRTTTGRWNDPELSVEIGRKSSREANGIYAGDGLAWSVTLAQRFDFSGRNALRKAIAEKQIERAQAGLEQFRRELGARAAELAHALLAAQQRLEATEECVARTQAVLASLAQREPSGILSVLEMRVIEAGLKKLSYEAVTQRARLSMALGDLNLLRGLPPASPLSLANETNAPVEAPADASLLATAFRSNYTLRQYELELQEQGIALDLERKNLFNEVTLSAYYSEEKAGAKDRAFGLGASLPLPLWNRNAASISEARSRQGQAETALFRMRRDLHKELLAAAALYRANQSFLCENNAVELARFHEAAAQAERHYRLGAIPMATYLGLQQAYLEMVELHTTARTEAIRAAAQISILAGLPLQHFFPSTAKGGAQ
ncbi:MAG: TolC family protein [Puniceicoccales bacterium]|nr:TolC family protein [Puniceicoccales bacterium]